MKYELVAVQRYESSLRALGHDVQTFSSGLRVRPDFPWLGAPPDRIICYPTEATLHGVVEYLTGGGGGGTRPHVEVARSRWEKGRAMAAVLGLPLIVGVVRLVSGLVTLELLKDPLGGLGEAVLEEGADGRQGDEVDADSETRQ
ncbi:hypothetical protein HPB47_002574 [Ixodes persulcatus]|uniref:Uncharacterized protein n=1 Tax=Ixodes persulcatus TaxID=34615 RepID=A0AC60PKT4_IXOPE|nr:hypothetical protein HPB47_002574 [Ixodes persulcatus]